MLFIDEMDTINITAVVGLLAGLLRDPTNNNYS